MFCFFRKKHFKSVGRDVRLAKGIIVKNSGTVGSHVAIDHGFYCTVPIKIGDYIHISPYCTVIGGSKAFFEMEDFSGLAAGCRIICASDEMKGVGIPNPTIPPNYRDRVINLPVVIKKFATISTNAIICPGVTIEEGCVIGANSLVMKSTEPWSVYAGSPAKFIRPRPAGKINLYAEKLIQEKEQKP